MKKNVGKIKVLYSNSKLHTKLMISYLFIISIPMALIAMFYYGKVYDMIVSDTIRMEQEESATTAPVIEQAVNEILNDSEQIQDLPFFSAFTMEESQDSANAALFADQVEEIIQGGTIQKVRVYIDFPITVMNQFNQLTDGIMEPISNINGTYWKGIFSGSGISSLHCPSFYLSNYEIENYGDMAFISKKNYTAGGQMRSCYLAVYYSSDIFLDILNDNLPSAGNVAYIINDRNSLIATTNPALSSTYYLNYSLIQDSFMSSNNFLKKSVLGEEIFAGMYSIKQPQWYMVVVIPSAPLIRESKLLMLQYFSIFIVCVIAALFIATKLSRSITKRLAMVTNQMGQVRMGPPIPLKESKIHDEIGELIDTYNYMTGEMNRLLIEKEKTYEELRIAEFNSLQAQINPHFLYNTMDMINWMATQGQNHEITKVVQNLSRFYKLTLSKKETVSTIEQEIEHATIYVHLQNMRFRGKINFVVDIPDGILDYQIPKLTLQPVIENSIQHGIMEKEDKKGTIVITAWSNENVIEILVSDDGVGIAHEKLEKILTGESKNESSNNIAIYNTHHRLQILYGKENGLTYHSIVGKGTEVLIRLPAKTGIPIKRA